MKRILAALLCICAPVYAQDPKVEFFTPDATGCMILRECKEDVVQIKDKDQLNKIVTGPDAELIKKEFGQLVDAITDLGIEIYIAPARYFGHKDQGIYHTKYNAVFLNLRYMRDTKHLIGTLRHEGWHLAQDCMAGTLDNSLVAVIMNDKEIPEIHKYLTGVLYRDNKPRPIPKSKIIIKDEDLIQTKNNGKIKILLFGGDEIFLAPNSEIKFEEKIKLVGLAKKINRSFNLSGRLLAKIKKNLSRETNIRTVNAIVGVKGTDFIVEYVNDNTRVGTIEGTVTMTSVENKKSIDIDSGKMSSVTSDGTVLPIKALSGEMMHDFEFAGERMNSNEASGKKIDLN